MIITNVNNSSTPTPKERVAILETELLGEVTEGPVLKRLEVLEEMVLGKTGPAKLGIHKRCAALEEAMAAPVQASQVEDPAAKPGETTSCATAEKEPVATSSGPDEILRQELSRLGFEADCTPEVVQNLRQLGVDTVSDLQGDDLILILSSLTLTRTSTLIDTAFNLQGVEQTDFEEAGIRKLKARQLYLKLHS